MYKKLSNLNVGDIFQYGDTIYEIVEKGVWHAKCPDGEIGRQVRIINIKTSFMSKRKWTSDGHYDHAGSTPALGTISN